MHAKSLRQPPGVRRREGGGSEETYENGGTADAPFTDSIEMDREFMKVQDAVGWCKAVGWLKAPPQIQRLKPLQNTPASSAGFNLELAPLQRGAAIVEAAARGQRRLGRRLPG